MDGNGGGGAGEDGVEVAGVEGGCDVLVEDAAVAYRPRRRKEEEEVGTKRAM